MARAKAGRAGRRQAKRARPRGTPEDRLIEAALALAARQDWRRTGLARIAQEAGLSLPEAYALHRSKGGILRAFTQRIDRAVLAEPGDGDSARERLFDVLMRRFEALRPHREALKALFRDSVSHPAGLFRAARLRRSMRWMLEAAGVASGGCASMIRVNGLTLLYISVLRVFLRDDSEDLGRTMAALDQALRRAEAWSARFPHPRATAAQSS